MRAIPKKLLNEMLSDPYYLVCARRNLDCNGRITFEHAFTYAQRQINEKWAIIPLCWNHHLGNKLDKNKNRLIALKRATKQDLLKYQKVNWEQELKRLEAVDKST